MARTTRNKVKSARQVAYTKERMALKRIMKAKYATMTASEKETVDERIKANKIEKLHAFEKTKSDPFEPLTEANVGQYIDVTYDEFIAHEEAKEAEAARLAAEKAK
jgi:hypothetical protein